ncbi:hypothetical protein VL20_6179 [Microcystis panniformis FACHB-1757]|uniref:Uncharacterized protein n=1 Tax=Microcystis panniformis FACHB-1757 TaxID=1638788 RepID=A0A0K1S9Y2_9CHRO|nr:hypothetical protein VL20_6179 [Microcystis panniformis FACHB-1757]
MINFGDADADAADGIGLLPYIVDYSKGFAGCLDSNKK